MSITKASLIDLNGQELILDADADTSITADTDDQIDIKIAGSDSIRIKANEIENVSGEFTLYLAGNIFQDYVMANLAGSALISSPSTSSTRYSYKLIHGNNATSTVYLNRTGDDDDANYMNRAVSTITIMEIAPWV